VTDPSQGPLVPADELFIHQTTDTFATVGQSERSWTEKLWASAFAPDGSLQVDLGLGIYPNRGVIDGFAGVSRGVEQWTVRASDALDPAATTAVGPITYEVIEPLRTTRFSLRPNDIVPVSFDLTFTGEVPPGLEDRELSRSADGRRVDSDIVRFHHIGSAQGWVEVEGVRTDIERWPAARDRSWGVRYMIGEAPRDLPRRPRGTGAGSSLTIWSCILCERSDGSRYALHVYYRNDVGTGGMTVSTQASVEHPDGTREHVAAMQPTLCFDPVNRRLRSGTWQWTMADGTARPLTVTALGETGFHLGAGLYFGFDGKWHGQWRGAGHVEGEHVEDCSSLEAATRLHQLRDCVIRVVDPVGGGVGIGQAQTIVFGAHPCTDCPEGGFL
jgi:hypothetical protein